MKNSQRNDKLNLATYNLESFKKDISQRDQWEEGRETGIGGISKPAT